MDFTLSIYKRLLHSFIAAGYNFQTFEDFIKNPKQKCVILRHDVDKLPLNSLKFAQIQEDLNIYGTYFFRCVPVSYNEKIILEIAKLGHEIGYHYEEMDICNGNKIKAIKLFEKNLRKLRTLAPIQSICMHGSPRSKFDNKSLWFDHKYAEYQIIGEPYFDLNFNNIGYLTDTGRTWNGARFSVRDKVQSTLVLNVKTTDDIIRKIKKGELPNQLMLTFHPQRWTSNILPWTKELIVQNAKNTVKKYIVKRR